MTFAVETTSFPPAGMASRALMQRFIRICSIWLGSARTVHRSSCDSMAKSMSSPISRRSIFPRFSTTSSIRSIFGFRTCRRLKARSCCVRAAARSPALWISTISRRAGFRAVECGSGGVRCTP